MCVSAVVEGFLVDWRCFIERQSSINRLWDVADNARRVIRFLVDIEWDVIRLVIWHVFTTAQVERDIKEIDNFLVGFDRYFKAVLAEDVAEILFNSLSLSGRCLSYSEAVVSVQAKVVAMFLLNAVQEVGANELTGLCTVEAAHGYIKKVGCCFLSTWLTHIIMILTQKMNSTGKRN